MKKFIFIFVVGLGLSIYIPTTDTYKEVVVEVQVVKSFFNQFNESLEVAKKTVATFPENLAKLNKSMKELEALNNQYVESNNKIN